MRIGFRFGTAVASNMIFILAICTKLVLCEANNDKSKSF